MTMKKTFQNEVSTIFNPNKISASERPHNESQINSKTKKITPNLTEQRGNKN